MADISALGEGISYSIEPVAEEVQDGLRKIRVNIIDKTTGEAIEEVDVYTSADSVTFSDNKTLPQELDYIMRYTNSNKMPVSIGGLAAGTSFSSMHFKDILTALLYPYAPPNIKLTMNGEKYYEYGVDASPITLTLNVEKTSEDIKKAVLYKDGLHLTELSISSEGGSVTYIYADPITSSTKFVVKVTDGKDNTYNTNEIKLLFNHPIYIGCVSPDVILGQTVIEELNKIIKYDNVNNINITMPLSPTEESFLIAYKSYDKDSENITIYDTNGFNITASFTKSKVLMSTPNGESVYYTVWKSNVTSQVDFDIIVKITN